MWGMSPEFKKAVATTLATVSDVGRSESNSHTERIAQEFSNKLIFIQFQFVPLNA